MRTGPRIRELVNAELALFLAILLLALVLRVGWPRLTEFKFSEARLEALALELTREGRLPLVGVPSSAGFDHSPISVYLYVPPFLLTSNPVPATAYGGLIGVGAVVLAWWLGRRWPGCGRAGALVAMLLFAAGPWSVLFSRKIWQIVFVPLLTLALVGLVVSALVRGRRWALPWGLALYAILLQVHPSALSLAPALALWLVLHWRQVRLRELLAGMALSAVSCVPFLVHQVQSGWPVLVALRALPQARWDLSAVRMTWETITGLGIDALAGQSHALLRCVPELAASFSVLGWLTAASALVLGWRTAAGWRAEDPKKRQAAHVDLILLSWLIIPVLFNLRHSLELHLHFFSPVLPAAFLVVGRAASVALSRSHRKQWRVVVGAAFGLVAAAQVTVLVLLGRFVVSHPAAGGFGTPLGDYLDVADETVALAYRAGAEEVLAVGQGDSPVVSEFPAIFDVLLRDRVPVRFVDGDTTALFPAHRALVLLSPEPGAASAWYASWPTQQIAHGYQGVLLDGSCPKKGLDPVLGERLFQNGVEIQGVAWQPEGREVGQIRLWLLWQVLWLSEQDSHFTVQMLNENGEVWAQQDGAGYPMPYRRRGDRIVSSFDITIHPEQVLETGLGQVGQYRFPEVVSIPLIDQAGNPVGAAVALNLLETRP